MPRLTIIGPEGRQEVDLLPHNTLGRHPNNTVQVLDRIVSKEHCHIDLVDGRYMLRDLGSLNGSYVNGERISERVLSAGDEIMLGSTRIIFDAEGATRGAFGSQPQMQAYQPQSQPAYSPPSPQTPGWTAPVGGFGGPPPTAPSRPPVGAPQVPYPPPQVGTLPLGGAGAQGGGAQGVGAQAVTGQPPPPVPEKNLSKVTIAPGMV